MFPSFCKEGKQVKGNANFTGFPTKNFTPEVDAKESIEGKIKKRLKITNIPLLLKFSLFKSKDKIVI